MNEPIYQIHANYCGQPRLLFAGYASRVARRYGLSKTQLAAFEGEEIAIQISPTTDRFGNAMPYQLWSAPTILTLANPSTHGA